MKIREFLRLRKQNDTLKIMCILFVAGVCFLISAVFRGIQVWQMLQMPAEYILLSDIREGGEPLTNLLQLEFVAAASRESELSVMIKYKGKEESIFCTKLSEDYIKTVYGIESPGSSKTYYMNEAAYHEMKQNLLAGQEFTDSGEKANADGIMEYSVQYLEGDENTSGYYKSAKLVLVNDFPYSDEPFIFTEENSAELSRSGSGIRIFVKGYDLEGMYQKKLGRLGYTIENGEAALVEDYDKKILLLRIQYELMIGVICIAAACWKNKTVICIS